MLVVHRAERTDLLVEILGDVLAASPLSDEMAAEVVAVPTRGVERWLTQRLSHRLGTGPAGGDGVSANIAFPFPGALVGRATAAACGLGADEDPWAPERLVWPLLEVVDANLDEPFLAPLAGHLRQARPASPHVRRFAACRHVADLYDHYGVHRPDMVLGWMGAGGPHRDSWQAELWRRLREAVGVDSPAERLARAAEAIRARPELLELPERLSVFGLTRLPGSYLAVLSAVAAARQVHLFLLHPSDDLWRTVAERYPRPPAALARDDDPTAGLAHHPLLRSWGRDSREMQLVLAAHGAAAGDHRRLPPPPGATLLARIQDDIRNDRPPPGPGGPDRRVVAAADDRSLAVHSCHGRARQVEVIRDAVLHLLAADPTLEPRDVIVMCPDIESFAPLIQATFGAGGEPLPLAAGDGAGASPRLRVRLADRSLRQTNPLLATAARLLELAAGRATASEVLDLAAAEPVRRRFRLDDDDLAHLERWVAGAGIRWGLDGRQRQRWGLGQAEANTWAAGMERVLLGVAMADEDERLFGGVVPYDDVPGSGADLAGRVAELVDRLTRALRHLDGCHTAEEWVAALVAATESVAEAGPSDGWQRDQLHRVLEEAAAEAAGSEAPLDLAEVRALLERRLRGRPTRANFRTGDLTFCTLVPMRSVPHRVICLLGLDDGVFPRQQGHDGDDLLRGEPRIGDRDPRAEDQQLLLDAVLAATDHLVITYDGRDERTNHLRPPAVPVAELLDVVDATARRPDGAPARRGVVVEHPLQPFDPRNFAPGALVTGWRWSYDRLQLGGARAMAGRRRPPGGFLEAPLPPWTEAVIGLDGLIRFVEHPAKAFLRQRLGARVASPGDEIDDRLPVELDGLRRWEVGERLLTACLRHGDVDRAVAAETARGQLPPGRLGHKVIDDLRRRVEAFLRLVGDLPCAGTEGASVQVSLELGAGGRQLVGAVPGVRGDTILRCTYSRLGPKHRLRAWVQFLALTASRPDLAVTAVTTGRPADAADVDGVAVSTLPPLGGDPATRRERAAGLLATVVDLYERGMREPLPLFCATSAAWAEEAARGGDSMGRGRDKWESTGPFSFGEDDDPAHRLVLGGRARFDELTRQAPGADESGPGWAGGETTRLGRLARRLWDPLLAHEELVVR